MWYLDECFEIKSLKVSLVWWPIAANQSKIIITKKKKNWKNEKNNIQKKVPQNYHGPWVPNLIKKIFFTQKEKKPQNYYGLLVSNLILSYLVTKLYI